MACASSSSSAARSGRPPSRAAGRNRRVIRPAPSGSDRATSGSSSMPLASSSEPPPMSSTSSCPALQPNQRRTARNVSRASSSPVSTCRSTPVRWRIRSSTSRPLSRVADRRRHQGQQLLAAQLLGLGARLLDGVEQRLLPRLGQQRRRPRSCSASRSSQRSSCIGVGCAPGWASTTSRCTVFEPTSSTPSRMGPVCPAAPCRADERWARCQGARRASRGGPARLRPGVGRVRRPRRSRTTASEPTSPG